MELAKLAYDQTRERFIIGKADINSLTLSTNRRQEAQRNYILALKNYWQSYFKIRKLTLYNFEKRTPIAETFDWNLTGK
jgi:outer membrane protein TolC